MKRIILIVGFGLIMVTLIFGFKNELIKFTETLEANSTKEVNDESMSLKGLELITDEKFKVQMLEILDSIVKDDYERIYHNSSKRFIKRGYPEVTNVDEYVRIREGESNYPDGAGLVRFLEVTDFKILNKKRYQVDYIVLAVSEGIEYETEYRYFFIYEDNRWKFDGLRL